ncbi:MAG: hypothetical protein GEU83_20465 [Pseudonocardiaceae bacterium]|nr:hypothetical protein [Pseudonocardiaceae bacterium]
MTQNTKRANKRAPKNTAKPAPPAVTDTEFRLWKTLEHHPGNTTKRLAEIAGIGRSTATKTLSRWADSGHATRVTDADGITSGSRPPSTWALATPTEHTDVAAEQSRLRPGELRAAVAAYLAAPQRHGQSYTPGQVARTLGRSAGAITNALHRLAIDGTVTQTSDRPRRFTHVPAATATAATKSGLGRKTSPKSRRRTK